MKDDQTDVVISLTMPKTTNYIPPFCSQKWWGIHTIQRYKFFDLICDLRRREMKITRKRRSSLHTLHITIIVMAHPPLIHVMRKLNKQSSSSGQQETTLTTIGFLLLMPSNRLLPSSAVSPLRLSRWSSFKWTLHPMSLQITSQSIVYSFLLSTPHPMSHLTFLLRKCLWSSLFFSRHPSRQLWSSSHPRHRALAHHKTHSRMQTHKSKMYLSMRQSVPHGSKHTLCSLREYETDCQIGNQSHLSLLLCSCVVREKWLQNTHHIIEIVVKNE